MRADDAGKHRRRNEARNLPWIFPWTSLPGFHGPRIRRCRHRQSRSAPPGARPPCIADEWAEFEALPNAVAGVAQAHQLGKATAARLVAEPCGAPPGPLWTAASIAAITF